MSAAPLATDVEAAGRSGVSPNGEADNDDILRIIVNGVSSQAELQTLADGLYEEIMRGELGGSVTTKALASFGGDNEDPDLLSLRPRDPIHLGVDIRPLASRAPNVAAPLTDQMRKSPAELAAELKERVGDENLARAVAYTSRNAVVELNNTFRVNAVKFDWDINAGISMGLDFHNYVMARNSIQTSPIPAPAQLAGGTGRAAGGNTSAAPTRSARGRGRNRGE